MHNVLNKAHNGINTCYYLLKQAMKDNGTLLEEDEGQGNEGTVSKAALKSSRAAKNVRPLSAPSHKVYKAQTQARQIQRARSRSNSGGFGDDTEDDSFIKEDNEASEVAAPG